MHESQNFLFFFLLKCDSNALLFLVSKKPLCQLYSFTFHIYRSLSIGIFYIYTQNRLQIKIWYFNWWILIAKKMIDICWYAGFFLRNFHKKNNFFFLIFVLRIVRTAVTIQWLFLVSVLWLALIELCLSLDQAMLGQLILNELAKKKKRKAIYQKPSFTGLRALLTPHITSMLHFIN